MVVLGLQLAAELADGVRGKDDIAKSRMSDDPIGRSLLLRSALAHAFPITDGLLAARSRRRWLGCYAPVLALKLLPRPDRVR
jgi:hypothetical protein